MKLKEAIQMLVQLAESMPDVPDEGGCAGRSIDYTEAIRSAKLFLENFDLMVENCKHTYEAKSISDHRDEKGKMFFIVQCKICQESGTLTLSEDAERFFNPVQ